MEDIATYISTYFKKSLSEYEIKAVYLNNKESDINLTNETIDLSFWCNNFNLTRDDIKESSIIEDIESLTLPLINLDLKKMTSVISKELMGPNQPFKPFYSMIKGVGGGKSRALEEIRLYYQLYKGDCLAIPITFIGDSEYKKDELQPLLQYKRLYSSQSIVLSVASRMIYMFYKNITFSTARQIVYEMFDYMKIDEFSIYELVVILLSELIRHFKSSLELKGKYISSFVLLIDESAKASDYFDYEDAFESIRSNIYRNHIVKGASSIIIMSSVKNTNYYEQSFSRPIYPLELAESLDINKVVDMIWIPTIRLFPEGYAVNDKLLYEDHNRLLMLASIVYTAPRIVEMVKLLMVDYLSSHYNRSQGNDLDQMNTMMSYICNNMMTNMNTLNNDNYQKLCKEKYLRALISLENIDCDDEVLDLIEYSAFVNQLTVRRSSCILPTANIVFLHKALKSIHSNKEINKSLVELFDLFLEYISTSKSDSYSCEELFKLISMKWMKTKLQSMGLLSNKNDDRRITLKELFEINFSNSYTTYEYPLISPYNSNPLKKRLNKHNYRYNGYSYVYDCKHSHYIRSLRIMELSINEQVNEYSITCSVKNISQWKNEIKQISDTSVAVMKSSNNDVNYKEKYDFGLLAAFKDHSLVIFVDAKSFDESISPNRSSINRKDRSKPFYYHYFDMCNVQNEITEDDVMGLKSSNYLRAIYQGNWLYIYQTNSDGPAILLTRGEFVDEITSKNKINDSYHKKNLKLKYGSMLLLNRESSLNYLSLISKSYKVIRDQVIYNNNN